MSKLGKTNYVTQQQLKTIRGKSALGHIHSNKDTLDTLTPEKIAQWDSMSEKAHTHDNKDAIDLFAWDQETNTVILGSSDNPVSFAVFGDVTAGGIGPGGGGGGAKYLYQLEDVPDYRAQSWGKYLRVKSDGSGVEWADVQGGGVISVAGLTGIVEKSALQAALNLGALAYKSSIENGDIQGLSWNKITSDKPTTIAGYGITDAKIQNGTITLGSVSITPVADANYVHTDNNFTNAHKTLLDYFGYDAANHAIYLKEAESGGKKLSFYVYGEITAGGVGSGSGGGGGASYLYQLEDVPDYRAQSWGKYLRVKSDGSGVEWADVQGGGVTSFNSRTGDVSLVSSDVTSALGYTPYNASNPSGYISTGGIVNGAITFGGDDSYGIFTNADNYCSIGTSSKAFYRAYIKNIYGNTIYEGGTSLSNKYASISSLNAKQDTISDLSTIRSRSDEGHTAYNWGNHANAGYAYASSLNSYLPKSGGTVNGAITFGGDDTYGIFTSSDNYCSIGTSSKAFYRAYIHNIYGNTIYENGTSLSSKYAAKSSLGDMAYVDSLSASDIPSLPASKITSGTFADARIASAATWNAKQDTISDLSTIRSRSDEGHTAYNWGNHANAGYATQTYVSNNYHPKGGSTTLDFTTRNLDVHGTVVATGEITAGSDARWKRNITPVADNPIMHLNPCEWDWEKGHGNGHSAGLIAQEVLEILPFAVKGNDDAGYTLNYNVFHAYEIAALQSQETEIENLRRRVGELEKQLKQLKS